MMCDYWVYTRKTYPYDVPCAPPKRPVNAMGEWGERHVEFGEDFVTIVWLTQISVEVTP